MSDASKIPMDDGVAIAVHRFGPALGGGLPPVVLHHGFAADTHANWVAPGVVAALVDAGRAVVSVDARGHGASDKPHEATFYGEGRMARDLSAVFDWLEVPQVDLAGYSMGAIVSLITAAADPRIRRMVIGGIGGSVVDVGGVARAIDRSALVAALRADDPSTIVDRTAKQFRRFADSTGADRLALAAQAESILRSPIALSSISAPTRLVVGDTDALATRPERLVDAIPDAELVVVPGDHLGAVAAPGFAPAIVEFLAG